MIIFIFMYSEGVIRKYQVHKLLCELLFRDIGVIVMEDATLSKTVLKGRIDRFGRVAANYACIILSFIVSTPSASTKPSGLWLKRKTHNSDNPFWVDHHP